jgi:hypothetical protein
MWGCRIGTLLAAITDLQHHLMMEQDEVFFRTSLRGVSVILMDEYKSHTSAVDALTTVKGPTSSSRFAELHNNMMKFKCLMSHIQPFSHQQQLVA